MSCKDKIQSVNVEFRIFLYRTLFKDSLKINLHFIAKVQVIVDTCVFQDGDLTLCAKKSGLLGFRCSRKKNKL